MCIVIRRRRFLHIVTGNFLARLRDLARATWNSLRRSVASCQFLTANNLRLILEVGETVVDGNWTKDKARVLSAVLILRLDFRKEPFISYGRLVKFADSSAFGFRFRCRDANRVRIVCTRKTSRGQCSRIFCCLQRTVIRRETRS